MISRRGFFGMLAGLAAAPALKPIAKLIPKPETYTTFLLPEGCLTTLTVEKMKEIKRQLKQVAIPVYISKGGETVYYITERIHNWRKEYS